MSEKKSAPPMLVDADMRQFMSRLMAGYEAMHRAQGDLLQMVLDRLHKAESITERSLETQLRVAHLHEDLISQHHRRELETLREKAAQEERRAMGKELRKAGTLLFTKVAGISLPGNDSHGLQDLLASMSLDQIDAAMTTGTVQLTPAQREKLAGAFASLAKSEADEAPKAAE